MVQMMEAARLRNRAASIICTISGPFDHSVSNAALVPRAHVRLRAPVGGQICERLHAGARLPFFKKGAYFGRSCDIHAVPSFRFLKRAASIICTISGPFDHSVSNAALVPRAHVRLRAPVGGQICERLHAGARLPFRTSVGSFVQGVTPFTSFADPICSRARQIVQHVTMCNTRTASILNCTKLKSSITLLANPTVVVALTLYAGPHPLTVWNGDFRWLWSRWCLALEFAFNVTHH